MFTGIIEAQSKVLMSEKRGNNRAVHIAKPAGWTLEPGQSISIDGICSTVEAAGGSFFEVEFMHETLKKTTAGFFKKGTTVNLERPLKVGGRLDGHFVLGHVDARCPVSKVPLRTAAKELAVRVPAELSRLIVPRGSVTFNGVALTVVKCDRSVCTVALIPYTLSKTNLGTLRPDDMVNVEVDVIARYVAARRRS